MIVEVQFSEMRKEFLDNPDNVRLSLGDTVVCQFEKRLDIGMVIKIVEKGVPTGKVVRRANESDVEKLEQNKKIETEGFKACQQKIKALELGMRLVSVEHSFQAKKMTFYFTADTRVDFRDLVRDLGRTFKTRIEMHQIGVRECARRLGGCGPCGRQLCCTTFLREFEPVTLQTAKEQNLTVNPAKMSGVCGRLMCCLIYERKFYAEALSRFPRVGSTVETEKGKGVVKEVNIFSEVIALVHDSGELEKVTLAELKERRRPWFLPKRKRVVEKE
jgi:cell fate regulator YaaT (PSP1 superfamily)